MNDDRQFERTARTWLDIGPTDVPGRVVEAALLAIETTTQERDLRIPWWLPRMTNTVRLGLAATISILVLGGGLLLVGGRPAQDVRPSPTPSETSGAIVQPFATTDPGSAAFALALESEWTSVGLRSQPLGLGPHSATMWIGPTGVRISAFNANVESAWSASAPDGRLAVRMVASQRVLTHGKWDCRPGQDGVYTATLSAGGGTLTLVAEADDCAARAAILAGTWTRTPCQIGDNQCNELAAGRHESTVLLPGDVSASPAIASYSYDVPVGWTIEYLADGTLSRRADVLGINLRVDLAPRSQAAGCPEVAAEGTGTNAAGLAAWLRAFPGVTTTTPTAISIGGYSGVTLDLSDDLRSTAVCHPTLAQGNNTESARGVAPEIFIYKHSGPSSDLPTFYGSDDRSRYVILDLPGGHNLLIDVTTADQQSFDEFVPAAMPIINSLQFAPAGP